MPVKKNTTKTSKQTAQPDKSGKKAPVRSKSRKKNGGSALYVLVIMCLLAVIALSAERFYDRIFKPSLERREIQNETEKISAKEHENIAKPEPESKNETPEKPISRTARVYLIKYDEKTERAVLVAVNRNVDSELYLQQAIVSLMQGPTPDEKRKGFLTAIDHNAKVRSITLKNRIADIDFNSAIESGGGGELNLNRLDQIVYTATQFDGVDAVRIRINGKAKSTFGSDGISISSPLRRK